MKKLPEKYLSAYNSKNVETEIYKKWEDSGYFNHDNLKNILKAANFSYITPFIPTFLI